MAASTGPVRGALPGGTTSHGTVPASNAAVGVGALVAANACWASVVVTIKIAARGLSVPALTFVELLSAVAALGALLLVRRTPIRRPSRVLVVAAVLEPALAYPLINAGLQRTSGSHAALIIGLEAVLVVVGAAALDRNPPSRRVVLALVLSVAGAALLSGGDSGAASWSGDLLVAVGIAAAASYVLLAQRRVAAVGADAATTTFWQFLIGALAVSPFLLLGAASSSGAIWGEPSVGEVLAAVVTGVLGSAVAFGFYNWGLARVSTALAGVSLGLIPVFGIALSAVFLHETVTVLTVGAVVAVLAGVSLAATDPPVLSASPDGAPTPPEPGAAPTR